MEAITSAPPSGEGGKESGRKRAMNARFSRAFTLVEIMIVVTIVGLLASLCVFNIIRARATAQKSGCINNLSQLDRTKFMWALETGKGPDDTPPDSELFGQNAHIKKKPICPGGGDYTIGAVGVPTRCSVLTHILP